jgi:hypothetical protein
VRRQHQVPVDPVRIGAASVMPVSSVRNLGVRIDGDVTMASNVAATVSACFAALRQIASVRRSLPRHALLTLIRALVISKFDYCNSVLAGISGRQLNRLQFVLNAAARMIFAVRRSEHVTRLLRDLHWLRMPESITFKLCVLVYRCLHGAAQSHLACRRSPPGFGCRRSPEPSFGGGSDGPATPRTQVVPANRRSSLGDRSFYAAAPRA